MAHLEIETRDGAQQVALDRDRLSIGRLAFNDVVLPFAQVSRQHAELRRINGQWWIADMHSTNGLHLNARRIQERALQNGDTILLAPGISLRFVDDHAPTRSAEAQSTVSAGPSWSASPASMPPLRPSSPFADDEVPFVPPALTSHPVPPAALNMRTMPLVPSRNGARPGNGSGALSGSPPQSSTTGERDPAARPDGYPVPSGPLVGGGDGNDFYRRSAPNSDRAPAPTRPVANLLHICQTCGQLTAPDAIYCQSCHQPIARECPTCGLNLLPIQERCPRCHTANHAYVGKAHPGRPPA
jgi:predicted component of type VI protein secretion system